MRKKQKTIFITVGRAFIVKSILRSGTLEHLKKSGHKIVIFLFDLRGRELPEYIRREFEDENVTIEVAKHFKASPIHRRFRIFSSLLVYNVQNRKFRYLSGKGGKLPFAVEKVIFSLLGSIGFLKTLARFVERTLFKTDAYSVYFDKYNPSVVFSTSIISSIEVEFLKEAKKRKIKTIAMARGWDNVTTKFYKIIPDRFLVQNKFMKKDAIRLQKFKPEIIKVCGFPQFDWHLRKDIIMPREEYFKLIGLDPAKKLILWGSTGAWMPHDVNVCDFLVKAVENDKTFSKPTSLLIRSHPFDAIERRFDHFLGRSNTAVDNNFSFSDFFLDQSDDGINEIKEFVNMMYHTDIVIVQASTLAFNALTFNKPVINTVFKGVLDTKGRDITPLLYEVDCYKPVIDLNVVDTVYSEEELIKSINHYLENPEYKSKERKDALEELCHKVDGNVSKRIADEVLSLIE
jgi:CDP-glycerol glycerophosphotransferase (TagB/SpsB family)